MATDLDSRRVAVFRPYKFACRMGTNPDLTARAFYRCGEVDWSRTAVKDEFKSYDCSSGKVYGLGKEVVLVRKRITEVDEASTTVTLEAIPVTFCAYMCHVDLGSNWQDCANYCWQRGW